MPHVTIIKDGERNERKFRRLDGRWSHPCANLSCLNRRIYDTPSIKSGLCPVCKREASRAASAEKRKAGTRTPDMYVVARVGVRETTIEEDAISCLAPFADPNPPSDEYIDARAAAVGMLLSPCGCGGGWQTRRVRGSV